jgi:hypothetical protein
MSKIFASRKRDVGLLLSRIKLGFFKSFKDKYEEEKRFFCDALMQIHELVGTLLGGAYIITLCYM